MALIDSETMLRNYYSALKANTFEDDFGMMRHLGSLGMALYPRKEMTRRNMMYKDWSLQGLKSNPLSPCSLPLLILSLFLKGKKGDFAVPLF